MTWKNTQESHKKKHQRGARRQVWLATFYASLNGAAAHLSGCQTPNVDAHNLIKKARLLADEAVRVEFGDK